MRTENFSQSHKGDILIVEDLISNLEFYSQILKHAGYKVRSERDGESALSSVKDKIPDLILMDISLPGINGIEVCDQLKSSHETSKIPIIFLSAFNKSEMKVAAYKAGGIDYITKPVESSEILIRIDIHLKMNKLQKELENQSELLREEIIVRKDAEQKLKNRMLELDNMNKFFVNRENKMIDLKNEINNLLIQKGDDPKYNIPG